MKHAETVSDSITPEDQHLFSLLCQAGRYYFQIFIFVLEVWIGARLVNFNYIEPYNDYKTSEPRIFIPKNILFKKYLSKLT